MGLANLALVWGAQAFGLAAMTPVLFVFLYYLLATTAELCLSPVGLSAMNRLAPKFMASLIMGAWFYMSAVGNFLAGKIGEATGGHDGEMTKEGLLDIYSMFGWITIGIGVGVLALSPIVRRWMHLDSLQDDTDARIRDLDATGEPIASGPAAGQGIRERTTMARTAIIGAAVLAVLTTGCATTSRRRRRRRSAINDGSLSLDLPALSRRGDGDPRRHHLRRRGRPDRQRHDRAGRRRRPGDRRFRHADPRRRVRRSTARGKFVTPGIIDVHSHLGDYPSPGTPSHSDGNEATAPARADVWAEHSVWPQDPGFSRALANGGVTALQVLPGSANLFGGRGVTLKNVPARTMQGDEVPRRALRPQDGVRREPQAGLRQQGRPVDPDGQYRHRPRDLAQGQGLRPQVGQI